MKLFTVYLNNTVLGVYSSLKKAVKRANEEEKYFRGIHRHLIEEPVEYFKANPLKWKNNLSSFNFPLNETNSCFVRFVWRENGEIVGFDENGVRTDRYESTNADSDREFRIDINCLDVDKQKYLF